MQDSQRTFSRIESRSPQAAHFGTEIKNKTLFNTGSVGLPIEIDNDDEDLVDSKFSTMASYMIMEGEPFDVSARLSTINSITKKDVDEAIKYIFNYENVSASYVGPETDINVFDLIKGENNE